MLTYYILPKIRNFSRIFPEKFLIFPLLILTYYILPKIRNFSRIFPEKFPVFYLASVRLAHRSWPNIQVSSIQVSDLFCYSPYTRSILEILCTKLLPESSSIAVRKSPSRTFPVMTTISALSFVFACFWIIWATLT